MSTSAELRMQVESALASRFPSALSVRPPVTPELFSCGLPEVDAMLGGGLPLGAITELTGAHSSGRTTLTLATLAGITQQGESCAYVDASDAFDPASAAAFGVELRSLLWVRAGELRDANPSEAVGASSAVGTRLALRCPPVRVAGAVSPFRPATPASPCPADTHGIGMHHPRHEAIGLHNAVGKLFHPSSPEPVDFTPRCSESIRRQRVKPVMFVPAQSAHNNPEPRQQRVRRGAKAAWERLDQALCATDLLLNAGGFRAIVLDMGDVAPEQARRAPLATWYRFRLQAEKSRTLLLLMTLVPCANSCAAVSLRCERGAVDWQQSVPCSPHLLAGVRYRVSVERNRLVDPYCKKTAASTASWNSAAAWSR